LGSLGGTDFELVFIFNISAYSSQLVDKGGMEAPHILLDLRARDADTSIFGIGCDAFLKYTAPQHYIPESERKRGK